MPARSQQSDKHNDQPSFSQRVYDVVCQIPKGKVATYGQVAALIGSPRSARYVGFALHSNPLPGVVPCHRVVFKNGACAPGFAFGGPDVQRKLLESEGVRFITVPCDTDTGANTDTHASSNATTTPRAQSEEYDIEYRVDLERYQWDA